MTGKLIYGLDIGGSKIVAIVSTLGEKLNVTGFSSYYYLSNEHDNNQLVTNGIISDIKTVSKHSINCLYEAKDMADCSFGSVMINISGPSVRSVYFSENYELNGEAFSYNFVDSVIADINNRSLPQGFEILDYEIQEYLINDDFYAKNPIDMSCESVVANVNLFVAKSINVKNLRRMLDKSSNFNVFKIVPSGILSSVSVLTYEEKMAGICMLDIGASTTDVVVYQNGYLRELFVLQMGGNNIINDIRNMFKVSRDVAEELLINYGKCYFNSGISSNEKIKTLNHRNEYIEIAVLKLNDVILHRVKDILAIVKEQLIKSELYDIIESGFVLTGGIALLDGIDKSATSLLTLPTRIGTPQYNGEMSEILANPKFATIMGIVRYANEFAESDSMEESSVNLFTKVKTFLKTL